MMRLATAYGKTGDTGEYCAGVESTTCQVAASNAQSGAAGILAQQLPETQQHATVSQKLHQQREGVPQPMSAAQL
jgi:hypothetical protein